MKIYKSSDIRKALRNIGLKKGDAVFIFPETYKFGVLKNIKFHKKIYESFYKIISKFLGPKGTICIQSYTFDTSRFKKIFYYDKPKSTSGGFSNYILSLKKTVRSDHPEFSISSIGFKSKFLSKNNSYHNYGYNSPLEKFLRINGKILSLGSDYTINPFNHLAEHMIGVPYYYNKYENFKIIKNKKMLKKSYTSFVRYLNFEIIYDYKKLKRCLKNSKIIKSSNLGEGYIHCVNARQYMNICLNLLSNDPFCLIDKKKYFKSLKN